MAVIGGRHLEWREGGQLKEPGRGHRATLVNDILYLTGGSAGVNHDNSDFILSWDPVSKSWEKAGKLAVGRQHESAAVAISRSMIAPYCKTQKAIPHPLPPTLPPPSPTNSPPVDPA